MKVTKTCTAEVKLAPFNLAFKTEPVTREFEFIAYDVNTIMGLDPISNVPCKFHEVMFKVKCESALYDGRYTLILKGYDDLSRDALIEEAYSTLTNKTDTFS